MLLSADWHLTDVAADDYRWRVFDDIPEVLASLPPSRRQVFILGDLLDRKDRHSGALLNRLIGKLLDLAAVADAVIITMGNHDMPVSGTPYLDVLNQTTAGNLNYVWQPCANDAYPGLLLLPYEKDPASAWQGVKFNDYAAVFMHQTVTGAMAGRVRLENPSMPLLPPGPFYYSGDIHQPQVVGAPRAGSVHYVGAPHRVRFGDDHECRYLILNADYSVAEEVIRRPPDRRLVVIGSVAELAALTDIAPGDQVKIRLNVGSDGMAVAAADEDAIADWAKAQGVTVASLETIVSGDGREGDGYAAAADPLAVLDEFAAAEGIEDGLLAIGRTLLQEALDAANSR